METLIINVPDKKIVLVKQILEGLGVAIQQSKKTASLNYKQKLANVSVWTDGDLEVFNEGKNAFENLRPEQW
jgi:hypothetical protein